MRSVEGELTSGLAALGLLAILAGCGGRSVRDGAAGAAQAGAAQTGAAQGGSASGDSTSATGGGPALVGGAAGFAGSGSAGLAGAGASAGSPEVDAGIAGGASGAPLVVEAMFGEQLATGQDNPRAIAVDGVNVYWLNVQFLEAYSRKVLRVTALGSVMKRSLSGSEPPTVLASNLTVTGGGASAGVAFATDGKYVYWSDETDATAPGHLVRCSVDGCNGTPERLGGPGATQIAVDGSNIYATTFGADVYACSKSAGCAAQSTLWGTGGVSPVSTGIALDASGVYWGTEATVQLMSCPSTGCGNQPAVLMPQPNPIGQLAYIALDAQHVYLADSNPLGYGALYQCSKSGCASGPTPLLTGLDAPIAIGMDDAQLYWGEVGQVRRCSVSDCANQLATLVKSSGRATALAFDARYLYFALSGPQAGVGEIWRMPKVL